MPALVVECKQAVASPACGVETGAQRSLGDRTASYGVVGRSHWKSSFRPKDIALSIVALLSFEVPELPHDVVHVVDARLQVDEVEVVRHVVVHVGTGEAAVSDPTEVGVSDALSFIAELEAREEGIHVQRQIELVLLLECIVLLGFLRFMAPNFGDVVR